MLITAFRDLQWRLRRFIVAALGTAMVFALTLVLAGLTHGFRVEAEHVVDSLNLDGYLIQNAAVGPFMGSSRFPQAEVGDVARISGVDAALPVVYGNTILQDGKSPLNVNIYGVPKAAMPALTAGRAPTEPNEIAMSTTLKRAVGDEIELGAEKLRIVGLVPKSTTLAGQPNGFLTVAGAQRLMFSGQPVVSAIGVRGTPEKVPEGYRVVDRVAAVDDMVRPLAGAQMALSYMSVLLWGVACWLSYSAPEVDSAEQFVWSFSLENGYWKHPPLPTWIMHGLIRVFGTSVALPFIATQACIVIALAITWRLGCEFMSPRRSLIAMVPVSVHGKTDRPGRNQVSGMFTRLETTIEDPAERLRAIADASSVAKQHSSAISATLLQDWSQFAAPSVFGAAMRVFASTGLAEAKPVHNLVVSNVPGPQDPLYMLGAEVKAMYPLGPLFHGSGLNITVMSLNGTLDVGLISCPELVPDLWDMADEFAAALDELVAAATV